MPKPDFWFDGNLFDLSYQDTKSARFAWLKIYSNLSQDRELPAWVLSYLLTVAERLLKVTEASANFSSAIADAVVDGDKRIWFKSDDMLHRRRVFEDISKLHTGSIEDAIETYITARGTEKGRESLRKLYFRVRQEIREEEEALAETRAENECP